MITKPRGSAAAEDYYYFRSNGDYKHEDFLGTTELSHVQFEVRAPERAQVALLYDPKNLQGENYTHA